MHITLMHVYNELMHYFYLVKIEKEGTLVIGTISRIFPLGSHVDTTISGKIYYRAVRTGEPTRNLQCVISKDFALPNFESTQVAVITFDEVPEYGSLNTSIVSYQTYLETLVIMTALKLHFLINMSLKNYGINIFTVFS